jgi:hypothetical protein
VRGCTKPFKLLNIILFAFLHLKNVYIIDDNGNGIGEALAIWRFTCLQEASTNGGGVVVGTPFYEYQRNLVHEYERSSSEYWWNYCMWLLFIFIEITKNSQAWKKHKKLMVELLLLYLFVMTKKKHKKLMVELLLLLLFVMTKKET